MNPLIHDVLSIPGRQPAGYYENLRPGRGNTGIIKPLVINSPGIHQKQDH
ncbi:MAG: hypothetical protein MJA30_15800 [Cytophagales bacterium]|nr:hypothetical protein [Cytophagales bacterium]